MQQQPASSTTFRPIALVDIGLNKYWAMAVQLGKQLAAERKQLRLFRHPIRTLYYFSACAGSAAVRGGLWLLKHRITLTLLLPAIAGYIFLKHTGAALAEHCDLLAPAF